MTEQKPIYKKMSATKENFHDQIETEMRIYSIPELKEMTLREIVDLAQSMGIKNISEINAQEIIIFNILKKQAE